MSQLAGAPVRLQFMRWDEHGWDNYGPAQHGGHPRRGRREREDRRVRVHRLRDPRHRADGDDPTSQQVGHPARHARARARSTRTNSGTQYDIPNRRVIGKSLPLLNNYFKTSTMRAPQAPQTRLRLGAVDRRARLRGEDGPVRVPPPEHQHDRPEPLARRARRRRASSRTGSRASPLEPVERATSSPAAGSRSAATPARRRASSPTSR